MKVNIYTPNIIPAGKNGLSSRANFIQRRLYDKMFKTLKLKNYFKIENLKFKECNRIDAHIRECIHEAQHNHV